MLKYGFKVKLLEINYWVLIIIGIVLGLIFSFILKRKRVDSLDNFKKNVIKYEIVEKYKDNPKWAIYLYFKNGEEGWNETIPGSFLAKNPENDYTFVFDNKEDALKYAMKTFKLAQNIIETS